VSNLRVITHKPAVGTDGIASQKTAPDRPSHILHSWKQIAGYIGLGVRTVQRYEIQFRMPVHRVGGKNPGAVLALTDEIDAWLRSTPIIAIAVEQHNARETAHQQLHRSCVELQFREGSKRPEKTKSRHISTALQSPG